MNIHLNIEYITGFVHALIEEFEQHTPFKYEIHGHHVKVHLSEVKTTVIIFYDIIGYSRTSEAQFNLYPKTPVAEFHFLVQQALEEMIREIKHITKA